MAFCDLKPVSAMDGDRGITYIIGNVFAIYEMGPEPPVVYSWDMIRSVAVTSKEITFDTVGGKYSVKNNMFTSDDDLLRAIALIECKIKDYHFDYQHARRLFPLKSSYLELNPGKETYVGEDVLDEGDTAASFIMLLNFKLVKILWLIGLMVMLLTLGGIHLAVGITRTNWLYFVPISAAAGAITALLVHIVTQAIARARFRSIAEADCAARKEITFVVCRQGFAACESCVYESRDLVPWSEVDYFIESDKMFIIYKNNMPIAFIPKRAFDKKYVGGIADIMALNLEQR